MRLHYNQDGTIMVTVNLKGQKIKMTFENQEEYNKFLKVIS